MKKKVIEVGTLRIKSEDLKVYEKTKTRWKHSIFSFPRAEETIKLFKTHNNLKLLQDPKNPEFLKGQFSPKGKIQGSRINILPDKTKLDKAYSLFAEELTFHDQNSNSHWDVMFKNPGGTYSYVYTLDKKEANKKKKFNEVKKFEKVYPKLKKKVNSALKNEEDNLALPMYTLLNTYMRVGNEQYFKTNGHKGLTTLKKADILIKGHEVKFNYLAKDGVPREIQKKFSSTYINRLKQHLKTKKRNSFVFTNKEGRPLKDTEFKKAFKEYCGYPFYPHIVRSYYATKSAEDFLKKNKKITKKEMNTFFISVARKLGHKKFNKNHNEWQDSFNISVKYYIDPNLVEKIKSRVSK